ncbi:MAG TPA: 4Fe-4S binding protein [Candidatus Nanopelagicaceae bacterium]|nr:4Fe-4S binding protein [Candidatus Nanopelagicaceae bacterium]
MNKNQELDLKPIEIDTPRANRYKKLIRLSKIPGIKFILNRWMDIKNSNGSAIPINVSLGTYEDKILPLIVTEYFIKKASHIVLMDCGCRLANECQNHDVHQGCTWLGEATKRIDLEKWKTHNAHVATIEEALERERLAYANGLVPHLGRLKGDSIRYGTLPDEGHFMSLCHCCSCCCILSAMKYGSSDLKKIITRMEGVEVEVNSEICVGCGKCFKVCIYDAMKMVDGKALIDQDECKGCGRCERECPNEAISIRIDDYNRVEELISRIESHVDVS